MKNIIITLCICFSFITAGISQFSFGAGAQFIFDGSVLGVQGKVMNEFNEDWRGAGTFTFHLEDFINFTIDLDAQYKAVEISDNFNFFPLAGLSFTSYDIGIFGGNSTQIGINLGAMFDFGSDTSMRFYVEPKINISGYDSVALSGGVIF